MELRDSSSQCPPPGDGLPAYHGYHGYSSHVVADRQVANVHDYILVAPRTRLGSYVPFPAPAFTADGGLRASASFCLPSVTKLLVGLNICVHHVPNGSIVEIAFDCRGMTAMAPLVTLLPDCWGTVNAEDFSFEAVPTGE